MVTTRLSSGGVNLLSVFVASRDMGVGGTSSDNGSVLSPFDTNVVPHSMQNFAAGTLTVPQ